jgi:hypothetical protein
MKTTMKLCAATAAVAATMVFAAPASAQATRTWVSGVGDDVNPCSRTAPCKTFAGAISKTAAGGEINCLDSGGFGSVTITKSIAIICEGVIGGVLATGTNGITINAAATDSVTLSGLDINGGGSGFKGVRYLSAGAVHIHNSRIQRFQAANGAGISFGPSTPGNLIVSNTTILNNGNGSTGGGIEVVPTGSGSFSKITLEDVRVEANANVGIRVDMTGATAGTVAISIEDTYVASGPTGLSVNATGAGVANLMLVRSELVNNYGPGLTANGANATVRVSDTTISGNNSGVVATNGATVASYGDNRVDGNPIVGAPANGAFTGAATKK